MLLSSVDNPDRSSTQSLGAGNPETAKAGASVNFQLLSVLALLRDPELWTEGSLLYRELMSIKFCGKC